MKQRLNEFLLFGLDEIKPKERIYRDGAKYKANDKSDFPGYEFLTLKEAIKTWRQTKKEQAKAHKKVLW